MLEIKNLHVEVDGKEILNGISLKINDGETHVLMGPNGSGKSTLSYALMGHPKYKVTEGSILIDGKDATKLKPNERAKLGLFLCFQYPYEVPGVTLSNLLFTAYKPLNGRISPMEFNKMLKNEMERLRIEPEFALRSVNHGFSGGEKKRCEVLQMAVLKPRLSILDEADSGLDVDALKIVAERINIEKEMSFLLITHYQMVLKHIKSDFVHIISGGRIIKSGGHALSEEIEEKGYEWIKNGE